VFIRIFGVVDLPTRIRSHAVLWALRRVSCDRVLDIGTGTGVYAFYITRNPGCEVVALDVDANRIEIIRYIANKLERHRLLALCGDHGVLSTLPKVDFSVILAVEVLQYLPDLRRALRELHERLRPGGVLIAHVPVRKALLPFDFNLFDDASLKKFFAEAGFERSEICQTFGRVVLCLEGIFSWCVQRPWLMGAVYPLLLLAATFVPKFSENGKGRLVIATKSLLKVTAK